MPFGIESCCDISRSSTVSRSCDNEIHCLTLSHIVFMLLKSILGCQGLWKKILHTFEIETEASDGAYE